MEQTRDKKEEGIYFCDYELFRHLQEEHATTLLVPMSYLFKNCTLKFQYEIPSWSTYDS